MKYLIIVVCFLTFWSCTKKEILRDQNQFIHFSQVYANELVPEKLEDKYDSILWSKNIGSFKEDSRGIIYEAEVSAIDKDTFWTAFVVTQDLKGDCVATVRSEALSIDEAASLLIENLETIYNH